MAIGEPFDANLEYSEDRAVHRFLEQAAPIILESSTLAGNNLEAVVALARRLGLSHQQLRDQLWALEQRGGIVQVAWSQFELTGESRPQRTVPRSGSTATIPPASDDQASPQLEEFRQLAERVLGRNDLPLVEIQKQLETATESLGLTASDVENVLNSIEIPLPPPPSPDPAMESQAVLSEPRSAAEAFHRHVSCQVAGCASQTLSRDAEAELIATGTQHYQLIDMLAVDIVRQAASEQGIRLQRDLEDASCHATADVSVPTSESPPPDASDNRVEEFLSELRPVIALEGGLGTKSRAMIDATADRMQLSPAELAQALAVLQPTEMSQDEQAARQPERRDAFRRHLHRFIAQQPEPMITFRAERRLVEAGQLFYGVAPDLIKPTINEVALETGARFVSRKQALDHVANLMDRILVHSLELDSTLRGSIYAEGTQWGLDPIEVETVIRQRVKRARIITAAHHRRNRWVLITVVLLTISILGFLLWIFLPHETAHRPVRERPAASLLATSTAPLLSSIRARSG
jgi:hypothetical protein